VDGPLVAVADGAGAERGQVGSGARFAEQLAPDLLARPQGPQEAPLLLVGAVLEDGRRGHAEADPDAPRVVVGRSGGGQFGVDDGLEGAGGAESAEALGVVHPGESGVEAGAEEVEAGGGGGRGERVPGGVRRGGRRGVGGRVRGQELLGAAAQFGGVDHAAAPSVEGSTATRPVVTPSATRCTAAAAPARGTRSLTRGLIAPRAARSVSCSWQCSTSLGFRVLYRPQWRPRIE